MKLVACGDDLRQITIDIVGAAPHYPINLFSGVGTNISARIEWHSDEKLTLELNGGYREVHPDKTQRKLTHEKLNLEVNYQYSDDT